MRELRSTGTARVRGKSETWGRQAGLPVLLVLSVILGAPWELLSQEPADGTPPHPSAAAPGEQPSSKAPAGKEAAGKEAAGKEAAGKEAGPGEGQAPPAFIRVRRGPEPESTALALETSIARYTAAEGPHQGVQIDLVAVVHIGERAYYEELNRRFADYDVVLYELVAPEGARVPKGGTKGKNTHPVSALQNGLKSLLALDFQLDHVDYTAANFVHADMTPEEMAKSMADRQESWSQMFFRMLGQGIAQQSKTQQQGGDWALFGALFAKDRPLRLKRVLAAQFEDVDASLAALDGPQGSTLITQRNRKALQVLDRELRAGRRRIAIFYGAGHMVDFEKRLLADYGLKRGATEWLTAWNMENAR
ncbi:MAG: hypothetical protein U0935_17880 [Pirellulales bacterium]